MYVFLCIVSFISVFPLYWMVSAATNKSVDVTRGRLIPGTYLIENFKNLVNSQNIGRALGNSFKYAVILTLVSLVICSLAGYGFEIFHDKGKDIVMNIILLAMMVPFVATLIPLFQMFSKAGWLNSTIGFILPTLSTPFLIMMFRQSARSFPHDIIEAARIDGAGELRIFWQIAMPNVKPAWLTVMIFSFQTIWNTTGATQMSQLVYDEKIKMVSSLLSPVVAGGTARAGAGSALSLLLMLPPIILFIASQSRIIETMSSSGMK